jgi:hypothetical protein
MGDSNVPPEAPGTSLSTWSPFSPLASSSGLARLSAIAGATLSTRAILPAASIATLGPRTTDPALATFSTFSTFSTGSVNRFKEPSRSELKRMQLRPSG